MNLRYIITIISIIIICISSFQFLLNGKADPMPPPKPYIDDGSNPIPNSSTPLFLKSENVVFYINDDTLVIGNFTIYNPSNSIINQTIMFPFFIHESYGVAGYENPQIKSVSMNNSVVSYEFTTEYAYQPAIIFNISIF